MRFAVIADIHANLAALEEVAEELAQLAPDAIYVAGDFLNRGPQPREVRDFLCERGWPITRGNHEDYVIAQCREYSPEDSAANPIWQPARWTANQIEKRGEELSALPLTLSFLAPDDSRVLIAHGKPQANNDGIFLKTPDAEIEALWGDNPPSLFICAHTHVPLVRKLPRTLVVNVGSVGLPFDGDARARFGLFTWRQNAWHAEIIAREYSRERALAAYETSGFLREDESGGGPLARVIMREVETARPHLGPWVRHFAHRVHDGELTVKEACEMYLAGE